VSLTRFLRQTHIRQRFREEFPKPKLWVKKPILAPPLVSNRRLVGTAFDYLFRFYLERRYPKAKSQRWIADKGLSILEGPTHFDDDGIEIKSASKAYKEGRAAFDKARAAHGRYIANGKITDALLKGVIALAKLDAVYRQQYIDENFGAALSADIQDLRQLITIVDPSLFRSKKHCILNPSFGDASRLVRGADADLIIDGTLIEIKVIKLFRIDRDDFNQLIGYAVLAEINRLSGRATTPRITKIGIYLARHAHLETWELQDFFKPETLPSFLKWFSETARPRRVPVLARRQKRKAPVPTPRKIATRR